MCYLQANVRFMQKTRVHRNKAQMCDVGLFSLEAALVAVFVPQCLVSVHQVAREVVGLGTDLWPRHRDRAPTDQHLVHGVRGRVALKAHFVEHGERLGELAAAQVLVDYGGVRGRQPQVESGLKS